MAIKFNSVVRGLAIVAACGLFGAGQAEAAFNSANLSVSASVGASCSISTSALAFGAYDPVVANSSTALDGTGGVIVTCTNGASTTVTLGQGSNANTGSTDAAPLRRMRDGATSNYLSYTIFQDSGHNTAWGNTTPTGLAYTGTGSSTTLSVYGRVAAAQNVPAGTYTDVVVATITF
ncbi:MAG: spore coat U domain-containing protein [Polyangiaceae bacterium]